MKLSSVGELERFKARLAARGFTQKYGIDFNETFSPVLKMMSLCFLFVLTAIWKVLVRQGDVLNAYLKAELDKPILMQAPPGLNLFKGKGHLLKKSLYGLKHNGRLWNELIYKFLHKCGFHQSRLNPSLYIRIRDAKLTVLRLYVYDLLIVSQTWRHADETMADFHNMLDVNDLGTASKCLGLHVEQLDNGIFFNHQSNITDLLLKNRHGRLQSSESTNGSPLWQHNHGRWYPLL